MPNKKATKHCKLQCFLPMLQQWFRPSCQTTCTKTLKFTAFSTHVEAMVQAFLPQKIAPKHCKLQCFGPMLKQWFKLSCQKNCSKTPKTAVFSTHVEAMVQAFLPNNLPQNTENYSVFHSYCSNGPSFLAKQIAPKHSCFSCFPPILQQ